MKTPLVSSMDYTVSIVEDEAVLREELAFQLGHLGFVVKTFADAPAFYRYLATHPRTLAVLDIGLAGEDGLSVCAYLRAHAPDMGIVFMTARGLRSERLAGLEAGGDAYTGQAHRRRGAGPDPAPPGRACLRPHDRGVPVPSYR